MSGLTEGQSQRSRKLLWGVFGMFLFMIGDWLLDAAGAGDVEVGLAVHSNWETMALWRFVASAVIALVAIFPVWPAAQEAMATSRENTRAGKAASRFWNKAFQWGQVILVAFGAGFHAIICMFPLFFKEAVALGGGIELATQLVNATASQIIIPLLLLYILCDAGISIAWYYLVCSRELHVGIWALLCCPLSTLLIDFLLKMIPLQFFKDFTVAFESLGWLLMYAALAVHARKTTATVSRPHQHGSECC